MAKKKVSKVSAPKANKAKSVLTVPVTEDEMGFSAEIAGLGITVIVDTLPELKRALKHVVEETVGEKAFKVKVEEIEENGVPAFALYPSDPATLTGIIAARKKKFKTQATVVKKGPHDKLEIGLTYDSNPLKTYPVLLHVPKENDPEHSQIALNWKEAAVLRDWLIKHIP